MTIVSIAVHGKAVGQAALSPKIARGRIVLPQPAKVRAYRQAIAMTYRAASNGQRAAQGVPVTLVVEHRRPRPVSHYLRDGSLSSSGRGMVEPTTRYLDLDHLARIVGDALTGVAYHDDAQITHTHLHRVWAQRGERERIQVVVSWDDAS